MEDLKNRQEDIVFFNALKCDSWGKNLKVISKLLFINLKKSTKETIIGLLHFFPNKFTLRIFSTIWALINTNKET